MTRILHAFSVPTLLTFSALALHFPAIAADLAGKSTPLVIAHRGASADLPEHTLEAYALAIAQGTDYIEPDLVPTRDGQLVARHENEIGGTTDVSARPEFASRRTTKVIEGERIEGWFTEDFTLAELKSLHARERLPQLRPAGAAHDGKYRVPTLQEVIALARTEGQKRGRPVGLYIETKHPSYFRQLGLPLEEKLLAILQAEGLDKPDAPVFIQSFEVGNLKALARQTRLPLIQLMAAEGGPADKPGLRYTAMTTPAGLAAIARYARGIGVEKAMVIPRTQDGRLSAPGSLPGDAHAAGLLVHVWTFRPENYFLPAERRGNGGPADHGDLAGEVRTFLDTGIDGVFSDHVPSARAAANRPGGSATVR